MTGSGVMVVDLLLDLAALLVDALTLILPQAELPFDAQLQSSAGWVNSALLFGSNVLPLRELLAFYRWVGAVWIPGFVAFVSIRFIVGHVPFLGGS